MKFVFHILVSAFFSAVLLMAPQKSEAFLIMYAFGNAATNNHSPGPTFEPTLLCLLILPICILDEEAPSLKLDADELRANGYTAQEIAHLESEQNRVTQALRTQNRGLVIAPSDTSTSLRNDLQTIVPTVSVEYINYIQQKSGVKR